MNGTYPAPSYTFINSALALFPQRRLGDDELDAIWIAVRRRAKSDAAVYGELARVLSLDELAEAAIDAALLLVLGVRAGLAAAQRRGLFFEYLDALLSHVAR